MVKLLQDSRDIAVLGAGVTGQSILRFLGHQVTRVRVFDSKFTIERQADIQALFPSVAGLFDNFSWVDLKSADLVVTSPGVDLRQPVLRQLAAEGVFICGDIELFCQHADAPIIAITGSNGKTTLATLVAQALELAGKQVLLGGNIGAPALDLLAKPTPDYYVLELSSYQLESTYSLKDHVAVLLNVTPDHMDRYDSYQSYIVAKRRIYRNAAAVIVNADESDEVIGAIKCAKQLSFSLEGEGEFTIQDEQVVFQDKPLFSVKEWALQGRHHWQNGLALLAVLKAVDIDSVIGHQVLSVFTGIEHRCQKVHAVNQVLWYDDSKATNEGATIAALKTLSQQCHGRIILIAGGDGKGSDFQLLQPVVAELVSDVILLGQDATLMARAFSASVNIQLVDCMASAVKQAWHLAREQDVVLLSPACSSLDMFNNFEHRGRVFRQCIEDIVC